MKNIILAILMLISFGCNTNGVSLARDAKSVDVNIYENSMDGSASAGALDGDHSPMTVSSSIPDTYDSYMEAYFRGLTVNMGENVRNECGYVALGQILSYYDSYLDDDIIPEVYDVPSTGTGTNMVERNNSPGILNEVLNYNGVSAGNMTTAEFIAAINNRANVSLMAKLLSTGCALGC
ncbi:MAG: hypothetical protein IJD07_00845 [Clostridia bacterium]|nr:hypothetical protein [Clostridia bacterium]